MLGILHPLEYDVPQVPKPFSNGGEGLLPLVSFVLVVCFHLFSFHGTMLGLHGTHPGKVVQQEWGWAHTNFQIS
jgi:hypothetical protein